MIGFIPKKVSNVTDISEPIKLAPLIIIVSPMNALCAGTKLKIAGAELIPSKI